MTTAKIHTQRPGRAKTVARERKPLRRLHRTVCFARLLQTSRKTGGTCTLRNGTSEQRGSNPAAAAWRWQDTLRLGRKGPTSGGEGGQLRRAAWGSSKGPCEGETHPHHHHTRATNYPRAQVLNKGKGTRGATGDGSGGGGAGSTNARSRVASNERGTTVLFPVHCDSILYIFIHLIT